MGDLKVGTALAAEGTRATGVIPVTSLPSGRSLDIPVIVLNGVEDSPCVWVDAVIHGDEPEGTLCCHMLDAAIDPSQLRGSLVLVPVLNVPAFEAAERGNPLDTFSYDLSGMFVAEPSLEFQAWMKAGDKIATIVDVYGETLAELHAPVDGMIFGLRALPNVQTGEWCCFYAEVQGELN